ncbi:uncharacterized protein LOC114247111 [Bombyx mandarina]|uniref:Uncharacterized protein LOC114247111 n=1 Tax=Bombyx mandarina TaxID=7092 RepID=A0A6J2K0M3_BOMMA|nr:uncharacterized protein LOC114247111 [Bombyx mandarina]
MLTISIFDEIERSFQQLYDRLETLENAITFANLGKMHPSIVDPIYINTNLAFTPIIKNVHDLEKAITVKAYGTNESLNSILEVPLVAKQPYNLLHLYSIPNDNNIILIPKNPIISLGNDEFAYPHEPCSQIKEDVVICKHLQ